MGFHTLANMSRFFDNSLGKSCFPPVLCVKMVGLLEADLDHASFENLASTHHAQALRFATAFLGDRYLAEDMAQEALGRLYERRGEYPLATHFKPYLMKTIARLCINEKRMQLTATRHEGALRSQAFDRSSTADPAHEAERRETAGAVANAVAKLPERERVCILLTVCEEMSYQDVADSLSLSFAEVNNAVHRACVALRKALSAEGALARQRGGDR
ncbi:MAG: RNA polymerase sigma factor, partial [Planctomycetota bacterium]